MVLWKKIVIYLSNNEILSLKKNKKKTIVVEIKLFSEEKIILTLSIQPVLFIVNQIQFFEFIILLN